MGKVKDKGKGLEVGSDANHDIRQRELADEEKHWKWSCGVKAQRGGCCDGWCEAMQSGRRPVWRGVRARLRRNDFIGIDVWWGERRIASYGGAGGPQEGRRSGRGVVSAGTRQKKDSVNEIRWTGEVEREDLEQRLLHYVGETEEDHTRYSPSQNIY